MENNTTNSTNSTQPMDEIGFSVSIITQLLYGMVCLVGLAGNTLVIYVVLRYSKMQTVTNMYIVNLAIADEFFLIGIPFLMVTAYMKRWCFGIVGCKMYMTSTSINQFTSSIFLTIMSADRYIAVCHPIFSPKIRTPFISKVVSASAWLASALLMIPVFLYATVIPDSSTCNITWTNGQTAFTLYTFVLSFAVPLLLIFVFYCLVIRKLKTVGPKNKSKEKKKSHRKVTKLVLTVITVYVFCWLPYWITQVALILTPKNESLSSLGVIVYLITGVLSYSNSAMNPILYAFLSDNFKKSFVKACTCAAGKDVNATLHMENSVFPRRNKQSGSERGRSLKGGTTGSAAALCPSGMGNGSGSGTRNRHDEEERGPLVSHAEHSTAITLTSRSNLTTISNETKEIENCSAVDNYCTSPTSGSNLRSPVKETAINGQQQQPTQV